MPTETPGVYSNVVLFSLEDELDFKNVHHLREVRVIDRNGNTFCTMQYSSQNISRFRPDFVDVPFKDQKLARELYSRFGGKMREGLRLGNEVTLEISEAPDLTIRADAV